MIKEPKKTSSYRLSAQCHRMISEMVVETGEKAPALIEKAIEKSYTDIIDISRIQKELVSSPEALSIVKRALEERANSKGLSSDRFRVEARQNMKKVEQAKTKLKGVRK